MTSIPYLSLSIWVPILAGLAVMAVGSGARAPLARVLALGGSIAGFLVTLPLYTGFDASLASMQFSEFLAWIPAFHINYHLGIDGISLWFVLLNSFITILVVLSAWEVVQDRPAQYLAAFLIMSGLINGVFCALDAILFYTFFEAMLIPMFIIIGVWGGPRRVYAALKFFLYTLLGSLLMLSAFIYMFLKAGQSFEIESFQALQLPLHAQQLIFLAMFMSFAVKVPMWPVHTWLPDAHVEAPTGGSVVLAAITLKIGAYGFLRFNLPITPDAAHYFSGLMITLSLIAVVYIGLVALVQADMKKLVAYSSISHMGFVTLGFFIFNPIGIEGGLLQMISHGFVSGAMFLCIGVLYDRMHSRRIADYGGVANTMPKFAAFLMLFAMANAGLPGTSGFIGEFLVVLGSLQVNFWYAFLAATTLIFGAAYTLWMYKRVVFGAIANAHVRALVDINAREFTFLAILAACVLAMGIYPKPFTEPMHASVNKLIQQTMLKKN